MKLVELVSMTKTAENLQKSVLNSKNEKASNFMEIFMNIQRSNQTVIDNSKQNEFDNSYNDNENRYYEDQVNGDNSSFINSNVSGEKENCNNAADFSIEEKNSFDNEGYETSKSETSHNSVQEKSFSEKCDTENKTESVNKSSEQTDETSVSNGAESKNSESVSVEEKELELQEKLKKLAQSKTVKEFNENLSEIASLMNVSVKDIMATLQKEGINLDSVKAALEEGDFEKSFRLILAATKKLTERAGKSKVLETEKANLLNKENETVEGNQTAEKSLFETETKQVSAGDNESNFTGILNESNADSIEENKGKIELKDVPLSENKEKLSDAELIKMKERFKNVKNQDSDDKIQNSDNQTAKVEDKVATQTQGFKFSAAEHYVQRMMLKTEGETDLSASKEKGTAVKSETAQIENTASAKNASNNFSNSNSQNFMFNQNNQSFSSKMNGLMRSDSAQQSSYTQQTFKQSFDQMIKSIKLLNEGGVKQVEIKLQPEHLGKVKIELSVENNNVTAKIVSDSEAAKQLIESNFNQLKSSLEEQGVKIAGFEVSVNQENQNNQERLFNENSGRGSKKLTGSANDDEAVNILTDSASEVINGAYLDKRYSTVSYIA